MAEQFVDHAGQFDLDHVAVAVAAAVVWPKALVVMQDLKPRELAPRAC